MVLLYVCWASKDQVDLWLSCGTAAQGHSCAVAQHNMDTWRVWSLHTAQRLKLLPCLTTLAQCGGSETGLGCDSISTPLLIWVLNQSLTFQGHSLARLGVLSPCVL